MPKTIEELKAELEAKQLGGLVDDILSLVDSEKSKGIELHRKQNAENQKLRKYKNALEALGLQDTDDIDEFTSSIIKKSDGSDNTLTVKSLNDQLNQIKRERDVEKAKASEYQQKAKSKSISSKLMEMLSDKVYGPDLLIKSLINEGKVDVDENENVIFKDNNDNILPLQDGIKRLLETRTDIVKNTQTGGAGTKGNNTIPSNIDAIMKSGNRSEIRKNLSEIKKQLGITA